MVVLDLDPGSGMVLDLYLGSDGSKSSRDSAAFKDHILSGTFQR